MAVLHTAKYLLTHHIYIVDHLVFRDILRSSLSYTGRKNRGRLLNRTLNHSVGSVLHGYH